MLRIGGTFPIPAMHELSAVSTSQARRDMRTHPEKPLVLYPCNPLRPWVITSRVSVPIAR